MPGRKPWKSARPSPSSRRSTANTARSPNPPLRRVAIACVFKQLLAGKAAGADLQGKGHIATYIVIEDGRLNRRMPDQPYNLAMVTLDEDPRVNFYSNLPGTSAYEVPVGAAVEVIFEEMASGQLIHEWRVVG